MPAFAASQVSPRLTTLLHFAMRRQRESPSAEVWEAYQRLGDAALAAGDWDLRTVVLDWLVEEMRSIRQRDDALSQVAPQLMKDAAVLFAALER